MKITVSGFHSRFRNLVLLTWLVPPVFGLTSVVLIGVLSPEQMLRILTTPLEPAYCLGSLVGALWYLTRSVRPIVDYLGDPGSTEVGRVVRSIQGFPWRFWGVFLLYLAVAPSTVIFSAEYFTDFVARPVDWFRIHLIALIVSIIVGLPIFFLIYDLFGRAVSTIRLDSPHVTVRVKVFLIGALVPLLIDTMLVQYYWTRTGFFSIETFFVWLSLEALAIGGSMIFVRSIGQSIRPLQHFIAGPDTFASIDVSKLKPQSTDEFGVLVSGYQSLLQDLELQSQILQVNNHLLREFGGTEGMEEVARSVISIGDDFMEGDTVFLLLYDERKRELVGVIHSGQDYNQDGHFRIPQDEVSMATMVYKRGETTVIEDVENDPRCSSRMYRRFNVKAALAVPMTVEGRVIGVLMATSHERKHGYTRRQITLMEILAREVAVAVYNHSLFTGRAEANQKLRQQQDRLEELVAERTNELTRVNKELEAFSYSVSHDLRAPLRAIDGFSQALSEDYSSILDDTARDYLARIRRGAQRMEALIGDLLQLARVSRHDLKKSYIDISGISDRICERLSRESSQAEYEIAIQPDMVAYADKASIMVVMENLLANAFKYTSKNERVVISVTSRKEDGEISFCVTDNGVGFDMQYIDKLFTPFQRLHSNQEFEGTGIGLATVARIVHKHGGRVWAESKPNEGASFCFSLRM